MHLEISAKKPLDVGGREEVRRAVGTVQNANFPALRQFGLKARVERRGLTVDVARAQQAQHVSLAQRAAGVSAKTAQSERGAATQVLRHVEPVPNGQVS